MAGLTVACFLWSDPEWRRAELYSYGPEHVHRLRRMVERHLKQPHEFVCITDERIEGVRTVPIDWMTHVPATCYVRLMLWRRDIDKVIGKRILAIDLDCVVTGGLDPLVDRQEQIVLWKNPTARKTSRRAPCNASIFLLTAGCRPQLYEEFNPKVHPKQIRDIWTGDDQAWLSHWLQDEAKWSHADGVYRAGSNKELGVIGVDDVLPGNARIVFFPGKREPSLPETQAKHPWIAEYLC